MFLQIVGTYLADKEQAEELTNDLHFLNSLLRPPFMEEDEFADFVMDEMAHVAGEKVPGEKTHAEVAELGLSMLKGFFWHLDETRINGASWVHQLSEEGRTAYIRLKTLAGN